jgi:hypothetical protein
MTPLAAVIALGPMLGALVVCLTWLIQTLTRIENRVTRLEVLVEHRIPPSPENGARHESTA